MVNRFQAKTNEILEIDIFSIFFFFSRNNLLHFFFFLNCRRLEGLYVNGKFQWNYLNMAFFILFIEKINNPKSY